MSSGDGIWVVEGAHLEVRPIYCEGYAERGRTKEFAAKTLQWLLPGPVEFYKLPTLSEQDDL